MPHLLVTIQNVPLENIRIVLENDKAFHEKNGIFLEYLWQNATNEHEVIYLFKIDSVEKTKYLINQLHSETLAENPDFDLPEMIYLE